MTSPIPICFQPLRGFPVGEEVHNDYVTMPELPGIGFEGKSDLYREKWGPGLAFIRIPKDNFELSLRAVRITICCFSVFA
jgi:hypothetical protein